MRRMTVLILTIALVFGLCAMASAGTPTLTKVTPSGASFTVASTSCTVSVKPTFTGGATKLQYKVGAGSFVDAFTEVVSTGTYAIVVPGLSAGANTVTVRASNEDSGTTTADVSYTVTSSAPGSDDLDVTFSMYQAFVWTNEWINKFLPVAYIVIGLSVGAWVIFKIRNQF